MTMTAVAEPALHANYLTRIRKLMGERYASRPAEEWLAAERLARFIKSIERLLSAICKGLPEGNLKIEEIKIQGDRVITKYRTLAYQESEESVISPLKIISLESIAIINLRNGEVQGNWDTVYQVNALSHSH
jgi:hypothetical protein